ncbi:MAG: ATP-grasp domain-containing protein [Pseudomonadota bacterium]
MNILLTLGRLAKGLELARSLSEAGHRVVVADPFSLHLSKPSRRVARTYRVTAPKQDADQYLEDLRQIIENEAIELVIPVSEEALYASRLGSFLEAPTRMFGPQFEQMERLHSKLEFTRLCKSIGLPAPETYSASSPDARRLADRNDYVLKPIHGCSGIGVHLRSLGDPFQTGEAQAQNLVQQRVYGRQISSFSIVKNGQVQVTALYEGDIYLGTVSVRFNRVETMPAVEHWIARFAEAEAYSGFISFDFIVPPDGTPFAIECNPRLTSGVHLLDRRALAGFVTGGRVDTPHFKRARTFQDAHSTLTVAVGAITRPLTYLKTMGKVLTTRDVVFDWRDPLPFFLMTPMSWDTIRPGLFEGVSLAEAVTRDILWTGNPSVEPRQSVEVSLDGAEHAR